MTLAPITAAELAAAELEAKRNPRKFKNGLAGVCACCRKAVGASGVCGVAINLETREPVAKSEPVPAADEAWVILGSDCMKQFKAEFHCFW